MVKRDSSISTNRWINQKEAGERIIYLKSVKAGQPLVSLCMMWVCIHLTQNTCEGSFCCDYGFEVFMVWGTDSYYHTMKCSLNQCTHTQYKE